MLAQSETLQHTTHMFCNMLSYGHYDDDSDYNSDYECEYEREHEPLLQLLQLLLLLTLCGIPRHLWKASPRQQVEDTQQGDRREGDPPHTWIIRGRMGGTLAPVPVRAEIPEGGRRVPPWQTSPAGP